MHRHFLWIFLEFLRNFQKLKSFKGFFYIKEMKRIYIYIYIYIKGNKKRDEREAFFLSPNFPISLSLFYLLYLSRSLSLAPVISLFGDKNFCHEERCAPSPLSFSFFLIPFSLSCLPLPLP